MRKLLLALTLTLAAAAQKTEALKVPGWFSLFEPENERIVEKTSERVSLAYDANSNFGEVVGHYETSFREAATAGVSFEESGDAHGARFEISAGEKHCKLDVGNQAKPHVDFSCVNARKPVAHGSIEPTTTDPPLPAAAKIADSPPGTHRIDYIIDGSASAAGLTYRNADGGTEQRDVQLPAHLTFQTGTGSSLFIAAQNKKEEGTVRVVIEVDGKTIRQAASSSPYGIASASGKLGNL